MTRWSVLMLSVLTVSIYFGDSEAARILGAFHFNGRSHFVMYEALLKGLAARGHQVYVIGHLPQNTPIPNYTDISVEGLLPGIVNSYTMEYAEQLRKDTFLLDFIWREHLNVCQIVLNHPKVKQLINGDDKFDLIITEIYGPDCFLGLSYRFNAPIISMFSSIFLPWANDRIGNPNHPAYTPNYFLPYTHHMTFGQRLVNTVLTEVLKLGHYYFADLPMDQLAKEHFGPNVPSTAELKKNTSLILANTHFSLHFPRPTVPALIEVGGLHINVKGKLPEDLEKFINESKHGVIYCSLGSLVRAETLSKDKMEAFTSLFSGIPQRVIWKTDPIVEMPDNVLAKKWLPQFEILSHPNVRAFISHCGLMGTEEAVYAGVPIIGIPLFADQEYNGMNYISKGIAVVVPYESVTKESLSKALDTVLNDPSYRQNAQKLSSLFRDRPQTPLETAVFWTEYVIRHGGAPHMRSAALELTWYQYLLLDVIAGTVLSIAIVLGIMYAVFKRFISTFTRKMSKKQKLK